MGWVKIEDRYARHPKIMAAGESALALDIGGLCYAREHDTDGFVPEAVLPLLGPVRNPRRAVAALVSCGRWERDEPRGGYWIHDFAEFNPSGEQERAAAAARSEKAARAARARWDAPSNPPASSEHEGEQCSPDAAGTGAVMPPSLPLPTEPLKPSRAAGAASFADDFASAWSLYPKREAKKAAYDAYIARRRQGVTAEELHIATANYAKARKGEERCYTLLGSTFYGPKERWKDYLEPSSAAPPAPSRPAWREQADANGPRGCSHCGKGRFLPGSGWVEPCACLGGRGGGVAA